ncbi:uncharacterized protein LOC113338474 [Papaver somniferum]|uniref:uncharacterized protein LOC113338474 n=1 Tax=Papaver somniferum TaxID=3469 RepID=UPI000E6F7320|nr:uncharacterized protein LOC113338474 [Papaver somniferum]
MSPFHALYGYVPPHLDFPSTSITSVGAVEEYMKSRDAVLDILKHSLHQSQERMKFFTDLKRTERQFDVEDNVYLKLEPYRQSSVSLRINLKLAAKYYGPYSVLQKIGLASYKPQLPAEARIHPVFHVSQLKKQTGVSHTHSPTLPTLETEGQILVIPAAVLDSRTITRNGSDVPQLLLQWTNASTEDATWEDTSYINHHFRSFNP